jgi:SSS family solute:Na+ symporter
MLIISIMTKLSFTMFAGALVFNSIFGWNVMATVAVIAVVVAVFTMIGGFTAVAYTDSIHVCVMIFGAVLMLFIGLDRVGGWHELVTKVPNMMSIGKPIDDPHYPFWGILATAFYAGIFYWGMDQVNVQRILAAPDIKNARRGAMFATLLKLLPIFIFALPGVIAFALFPNELVGEASKNTYVLLLNKLLPTGLRGLLLASLMAALVTALIAVLNSVSTLVVRDFIVEFRPDFPEKKQVKLGRIVILIVALLGVAASYLVYSSPQGLYLYLQTMCAYLMIPVFPAIFFGIASKKVTLKGATASVIVGIVFATLFVVDELIGTRAKELFPFLHYKYTLNFGLRGLWAEMLITAVLFGVSAFTVKTDPVKLEKTTINYSKGVPKFEGLGDWRLHLAFLSVITICIYLWLF